MKAIKITLVALSINGVLLPFYGLDGTLTAKEFVRVMFVGLREMFVPTCYIVVVYFVVAHLSENWFIRRPWRVILITVILICVSILSQLVWSAISSDDVFHHFVGVWGFYLLWTILTCVIAPLSDKLLTRNESRVTNA